MVKVDRLSQALEHLSNVETALVLLDLSLPDSVGLETFSRVYAHSPAVPIIVLTGNDDQKVALSAVKGGAQDYLIKSRLDRELLLRSMHYSIERKRYEEQLEHQANHDALTGLPNRTLLHDRLRPGDARAAPGARAVAVLFIDLDHFKLINDTLGHPRATSCCKAIGERARRRAARGRHRRAPGRRRVRADPDRPGERRTSSAAPCSASAPRCASRSTLDGKRALRHLQHRHRLLPARRARRRDAAQERRRGDVPRQGARRATPSSSSPPR